MNIPSTYYGHAVASDGTFYEDNKIIRKIDHACGTWFYGHDAFVGGNTIPWMRLRETVDRSQNEVNLMVITDGVWSYQST